MTTAASVAAALDKARRSGDGWTACCPAHDDRNPSLSITDSGDKVLVKCHAGCTQTEVLAAIEAKGIRLNGAGRPDGPPDTHTKHGSASAVWDYYSASGAHVGRVLRFDKPDGKVFSQVRRSGDKWEWRAMPEPRPLYRLRELQRRPDDIVLVCEGEKAADAAQRLMPRHIVVSWAGGADAAGKADWTPLDGRHVILWPDNDAAGRKAMQTIAGKVKAAKLDHVDLAAFGDIPEKWDAADCTADQFRRFRVVEKMQDEGDDDTNIQFVRFTAAELLAPVEPERYLIPNRVPTEAYTLIAGGLSSAKTTFLHSLILWRATGYDFLDLDGHKSTGIEIGPCTLISYEDSDRRILRRFQILVQHQHGRIREVHGARAAAEYLERIEKNIARITLTGKPGSGIVMRLDRTVVPNHAQIDKIIGETRRLFDSGVMIGLDPLRLAIVGSQNDDDGADIVVHVLNHIASAIPDSGLVVPSHTTKAQAKDNGAGGLADAAYATAGSALYSQHARSNFQMARLTVAQAKEMFAPDALTPEEVTGQRVVQFTHGRLSHGPETANSYFVMRHGVLVPIRSRIPVAIDGGSDAEVMREIVAASERIRSQGMRVTQNALERDDRHGIKRGPLRQFIRHAKEQGWIEERGSTSDKELVVTPAGATCAEKAGASD